MTTAVSSSPSRAAKRDPWEIVYDEMWADLARFPGLDLDRVDDKGYREAFTPLQRAIQSGRLLANDAKVWQVRVAIRRCAFRPTFDQIAAFVSTALGLSALPAENPNAYRPVTAPPSDALPTGAAPYSEARERAKAAIKALNDRGPQKPYTERDALNWVPSTLPGSPSDPAVTIPETDREKWIRRAYQDLYNRHKGRAPLAVRIQAAHLYRLSLAQIVPPSPPREKTPEEETWDESHEDVPAWMAGLGTPDMFEAESENR